MLRPPMLPLPIMKPTASTFSTDMARSITWSAASTASSRVVPSGMVISSERLFMSISGMNVKPRLSAPQADVTSSTSDSSSTKALWSSDQEMALR